MMRSPGTYTKSATLNNRDFGKNILGNGDFVVAQRGISFTSSTLVVPANDVYLFDRWYLLATGTVPSQLLRQTTGLGAEMPYGIRITAGGNNTRHGLFQMLESETTRGLAGTFVTLSAQIKRTGGSINTAELAIWTTTAAEDTELSDVVAGGGGSWTNTITPGGNWTELASKSVTLTTSFVKHSLNSILIPTSTTNIIVGVYLSDTSVTSGQNWNVGNFQLESGFRTTNFDHNPVAVELLRSQEYLYTIEADSTTGLVGFGTADGTTTGMMFVQLPVRMSANPSLVALGTDSELDVTDWDGTVVGAPVFTESKLGTDKNLIVFFDSTGMASSENYLIQKDGASSNPWMIVLSNEV